MCGLLPWGRIERLPDRDRGWERRPFAPYPHNLNTRLNTAEGPRPDPPREFLDDPSPSPGTTSRRSLGGDGARPSMPGELTTPGRWSGDGFARNSKSPPNRNHHPTGGTHHGAGISQ